MIRLCLYNRDKPPTKGVVAVNTNLVKVRRPLSLKLIWPPVHYGNSSDNGIKGFDSSKNDVVQEGDTCSIWFPEAPKGFVALGCVASPGITQPPPSSVFCISASLVCSCPLRDCVVINNINSYVVFANNNFFLLFLQITIYKVQYDAIIGSIYNLKQFLIILDC